MRVLILLLLFGITTLTTNAQKQWSNWVGQPFGVSFRFGYPIYFSTNSSSGIGLPFFDSETYNGAPAVAYSDSLTGNVKFVATGRAVYNRNYDTVENGLGLGSCGSNGKYQIQVI